MRFYLVLFLALTACREMANHQPVMPKISKAEAREIAKPATPKEQSFKIPLQKAAETEIKIPKQMLKPVSITVTEGIPLKNILIELARQADIDLQLDPNIDERIIFSAKKQPFIEVIKSMCAMANLRFDIIDNAVRIERDLPYTKNYNVQFLNMARTSENQMEVATDVFSSAGTNKSSAGDNGSKSAVKATTKNDFWEELTQNLQTIVENSEKGTFSTHKQAGLVSVKATRKQHQHVEKYLKQLRKVACSQVLIEAKIIEVTLKDEYRSGINWQKLETNDLKLSAKFGSMAQKSSFLDPTNSQTDLISFGATGTKFSGIANVLQEFGMVRTLSSPRLTVMNNQSAVLKVAQNKVYFRLNYDKMFNTSNNQTDTTISSDIQTVPIGLIMMVQPSIDPDSGEIILFLRPSISRLTQTVSDPAVDIAYNASTTAANKVTDVKPSLIPVVEVREIDSVLRLQDREMAILGGLMEVRSAEQTDSIPGLDNIPLVRDLTGSIAEGDTIVELVIILRATIVDRVASPDGADMRLMQSYTTDPRPISSNK